MDLNPLTVDEALDALAAWPHLQATLREGLDKSLALLWDAHNTLDWFAGEFGKTPEREAWEVMQDIAAYSATRRALGSVEARLAAGPKGGD